MRTHLTLPMTFFVFPGFDPCYISVLATADYHLYDILPSEVMNDLMTGFRRRGGEADALNLTLKGNPE